MKKFSLVDSKWSGDWTTIYSLHCAEPYSFADLLEYINCNDSHGKVVVESDHKLFDYNTSSWFMEYNYPFDVVASLGPADVLKCVIHEMGLPLVRRDYYVTIPYKYSKLLWRVEI